MRKVIVHIDLNAFFVRCEEIKNPSLVGKAVAIGHEGRCGIVSTCSYEARKYGVNSGMPMYKAKQLCPNLIIKPVDFAYYHTFSELFVKHIKKITPKVEVASIDEVYADFTDVIREVKDVEKYLKTIQEDLFKQTRLKCSIGVGPTKFLAKMGSDYKKPMGVTIIRKRDISAILFPLSIDKMFGVGKKTCPRLENIGVKTIGDLYEKLMNEDFDTMNILGKFAYVLKDWLSGNGDDLVVSSPDDPKSIGNSSTFPHDTSSIDEISIMFKNLAYEVSNRAKKENKLGSTIQIVVKDPLFTTRNKSITLKEPTNDSQLIFQTAIKLFEKNFANKTVRLVGLTLQNLIDPREIAVQMTFFDYEKYEEESKTKLLINELNRKLKKPLLKRASEVEKNVNK